MVHHDPNCGTARPHQWPAVSSFDLRPTELHDFSDLHLKGGKPARLLRLALAVVVLLILGHVAFSPDAPAPLALAALADSGARH